MSERPDTLNSIHERLASARGAEYWRCLEELADTEEFRELFQREYPRQASAWDESLDRRGFLKLMGASLALAGLSGCLSSAPAPTDEKIVPTSTSRRRSFPASRCSSRQRCRSKASAAAFSSRAIWASEQD